MASATANLRHGTAADLVREPRTSAPTHPVRYLKAGEYLYQSGEPKEFAYRVEKGALAVFELRIGKPDDFSAQGMIATAMRAVNAIPYVCAAAPGIVSSAELPLTLPHAAFALTPASA